MTHESKLNMTTSKIFTFSVQAVNTVTINGFALKQMTVTASHWSGNVITERIGSNAFLFNFSSKNPGSCDSDVFEESLCYSDSTFGTKQFSDKSCWYFTSNSVGIGAERKEEFKLKTYPNPANTTCTLEFDQPITTLEFCLSNVFGQVVHVSFEKEGEGKIHCNLEAIDDGMYFLRVFDKGKLVASRKIIKE